MVRYTSTIASAAALIIGIASAAPTLFLPHSSTRMIVPADLAGVFPRDFIQRGQQCPGSIGHTSFEEGDNGVITVPQNAIQQDRTQCTGNGPMFVAADQNNIDGFSTLLQSNQNAQRIVTALGTTGATVLYGLQATPRQCGGSSLPGGTILAFLSEPENIRVDSGLSLRANDRHMLIMKPNDEVPCVYSLAPRQSPSGGGGDGGGGGVPVPVAGGGGGDSDNGDGDAQPTAPAPAATEAPVGAPATTDDPASTDDGSGGVGVPPMGGAGGDTDPAGTATPEDGEDGGVGVAGGGGLGGDGDDADSEASPEESPEDDGSVCFPAYAQVELKDGSFKSMEQLTLNDEVLVADGMYSAVFMFTHKMKSAVYKFVKITTDEGSLTATSGHYVYVNNKLAAMKSVQVGDALARADGSVSIVSKVESVLARGLFNPQTLHGDVYVNGFKASTYTTAVEPSFAHSILAPFRALHRMGMNPLAAAFSEGSNFLARIAPKGAAVY